MRHQNALRWLARVVGGVFQSICIFIKTKPAGGLGWKKSVQKVGLNSVLKLLRDLGALFDKWRFGTFW